MIKDRDDFINYLEKLYYPTPRMEDKDLAQGNCGISDWVGGNIDDAYSYGLQDGKQEFIGVLIDGLKQKDI